MIPPLPNADSRRKWIGKFGLLEVYIFDPYGVAVSKLSRGFDSDIDDIAFLVQRNEVSLNQLEKYLPEILNQSAEFDLIPKEIQNNLNVLKKQIKLQNSHV